MGPRLGNIALLSLLLAVAAFVWHTSAVLPPLVATHFGSGGAADGHVPRSVYLAVVLALVLAVPWLIASLSAAVVDRAGKILIVPSRPYGLAPQRLQRAIAAITAHGRWLAAAAALFLGYVHWVVVRAHALQPPRLSAMDMGVGLAAFLLFLAAWLVVLLRRFRG